MEKKPKIMERFKEKTTPFIRKLAETSKPIAEMYFYDPINENIPINYNRDILLEKVNSPTKGLVHKFSNSIAIFLSYTCAANCRYCERQDRVGVGLDKQGLLSNTEIDKIIDYIKTHPNIREVVLSGGDPLMNPKGLEYFCNQIELVPSVKTIRIHTKVPIQAPSLVNIEMLSRIANSKNAFYFSVHINHPDELNSEVIEVLNRIRKLGFIMLSQSVFLKGINDSSDILYSLFTGLSELGVRPYYIYHCQAIPTTRKFVMDLKEEINIMTELRKRLSGTSYPSHVIDLQNAVGKITVPTNHWNFDLSVVRDFNNDTINLEAYDTF